MTVLEVVGIGTGNPDHLTAEGVAALARCDLVLLPDKGAEKGRLAAHRRQLLERVAPNAGRRVHAFAMPRRDPAIVDYAARVERWHEAIASEWSERAAPPSGG